MGNDKAGAVFQQLVCHAVYHLFCLGVHTGSGFVHYQYFTLCQNGTGNAYQLFLACRQLVAALANFGIIAFRQFFYKAVGLCLFVIYPLSKKKVNENTATLKARRGE